MNLPRFTAEASLSKRMGITKPVARRSIHTQTIHPAAETIEVFGCPPGSTMVGTPPDDWYCLPDPLTEPSGAEARLACRPGVKAEAGLVVRLEGPRGLRDHPVSHVRLRPRRRSTPLNRANPVI